MPLLAIVLALQIVIGGILLQTPTNSSSAKTVRNSIEQVLGTSLTAQTTTQDTSAQPTDTPTPEQSTQPTDTPSPEQSAQPTDTPQPTSTHRNPSTI